MKNLKKIAALGLAAAVSMSVGVSAFAAVPGKATASYKDGKVILSALADIDADHQWTVVVIKKADENATLTADKLYYINQGTSDETFWTNGMGTKTELADDEYIVRIGGETIDTLDKLIEIPLNISTKPGGKDVTIVWGDVDFSGSADLNDALYILAAKTGGEKVVGDANVEKFAIGANINDSLVWGDVDCSGSSDLNDALYILAAKTGGEKVVGDANTSKYAIGTEYTIKVGE